MNIYSCFDGQVNGKINSGNLGLGDARADVKVWVKNLVAIYQNYLKVLRCFVFHLYLVDLCLFYEV